jgi:hypothetical protein
MPRRSQGKATHVVITSLTSKVRVFSKSHTSKNQHRMAPSTPPLDFDHKQGEQIPTKHKEAICQLYGFAKIPVKALIKQYYLGKSTIIKVLLYNAPERA